MTLFQEWRQLPFSLIHLCIMSRRTILLITETTLGRFDLSGGAAPKVTASWVRASFASQSAGTLVDAALRLGGSRKRQVYVLTTRCWTGPVAVGPDLVSGASDDELKQTVSLEAETFSGISAFESDASIVSLPPDSLGDHRYWLTKIPHQDLRSIEDALRQAGAKLAGVGHPAAATIEAPGSPTQEWWSMQNWDETTLLMRGSGEVIADYHAMSSGLQSQRTSQEFAAFFQDTVDGAPLQWIGPGELPAAVAALPQADGHKRIDTSSEADLQRWAAAWMRSQGKQSPATPLITIPKRPMSKEVSIAIAAVLALLVIGLCFGHYWYLGQQLARADANIKKMQELQRDLKKGKDQLKRLNKDIAQAVAENEQALAEVRKSEGEIEEAKKVIDRGRRRWLSLVDSLAEVSDENGWIREIRSTNGEVSIRGLATSAAVVDRFAARLEAAPAATSWQILPASTKIDADTGLIDFNINLVAPGSQTR